MIRLAANLSLMYTEWAFEERFAAAAADGFAGVECQFPYAWSAAELAARRGDAGVAQVLINAPPGDLAAGERGLAALPGAEARFRRSLLEQALPYAQALGCPRIHVMAGLTAGLDPARCHDAFVANLRWATEQLPGGMQLLIEPLNLRDNPGYFLSRQADAHRIVAEVGSPRLAVQFDLYHAQIVEGDLSAKLRQALDPARPTRVGHIQIAGVPERHEPDEGELAIHHLLTLIDALGWDGWVGAEYKPRAGTRDGLRWASRYLRPVADSGTRP